MLNIAGFAASLLPVFGQRRERELVWIYNFICQIMPMVMKPHETPFTKMD